MRFKMKVETISYMRRVNLGNYEHEEVVATAKVEGEEIVGAILELKNKVYLALGLIEDNAEQTQVPAVTVPEPADIPPAIPEEAKAAPKKRAPRKAKEEVAPTVVVKGSEVFEVVKEGEEPKSKLVKVTHYNRSLEAHKVLFVELVTQIKPDWRATDASKALVKQLSLDMEGYPMMDNKTGKILADFEQAVKGSLI
jgi:hypothetical protein